MCWLICYDCSLLIHRGVGGGGGEPKWIELLYLAVTVSRLRAASHVRKTIFKPRFKMFAVDCSKAIALLKFLFVCLSHLVHSVFNEILFYVNNSCTVNPHYNDSICSIKMNLLL